MRFHRAVGSRQHRVGTLVVALSWAVASCSGGSSGTSDTTSVAPERSTTTSASTDDSAPPATTAPETAPPTTEPPAPMLPAGVQYDTAQPVSLAAGVAEPVFDGSSWYVLDQVDSAIPTCPGSLPQCTELVGNPVVHVVGADGVVTTSQIDDSTTYPLPAGFTVLNLGLRPGDIARGANGFVAAGKAHIWDSNRFRNVTIRSVLWFSPDGASWQRIDLRDVVGDVNLDVTSVAANGTGFLAAGEIGTTDMRSPSRGIVLASADGVAWHTVAELPGT